MLHLCVFIPLTFFQCHLGSDKAKGIALFKVKGKEMALSNSQVKSAFTPNVNVLGLRSN